MSETRPARAGRAPGDFPRLRLSHLPTPLEPLPALAAKLGGPNLWVKRDDCTGLATGGNKVRKLEFLLAAARDAGADTVLTAGGIQSNHVRQTGAAAARLGLRGEALLEAPGEAVGDDYLGSGNALLDRFFGMTLHPLAPGTDLDLALERHAETLRAAGARPYVIPVGGSNALGALGYVVAGMELAEQARAAGIRMDEVVLATGSAGTQAGLICGLLLAGVRVPVLGICVSRPAAEQCTRVARLTEQTLALLECDCALPRESVSANADYVGPGYGIPTQAMWSAVRLTARTEGLLLDPVYTGKAMAGLVDLIHGGRYTADQNVVFLHTGGVPALFGYATRADL